LYTSLKIFIPLKYMKIIQAGLTGIGVIATFVSAPAQEKARQNILFIVCDDLRPELSCYGNNQIITPNIDNLASLGIVFTRAYCNVPVCGASRASLFTGTRPTANSFLSWLSRMDQDRPNVATIPEQFSKNGYITISNGKVFHHDDEAASAYWNRHLPKIDHLKYQTEENKQLLKIIKEKKKYMDGSILPKYYEHADTDEHFFTDCNLTDKSIEDLKWLSSQNKPFLMAVGYQRPHLPFIVPEKYWKMYDNKDIDLPDNYVGNNKERSNIPGKVFTQWWNSSWGEFISYFGVPKQGVFTEEEAKTVIHGYRASVTFVDHQIGRLLQTLKDLKMDSNTTIVLIGDNGWSLGENGMWCKHSLLNTSLNVPLIISSPQGLKQSQSNQIVELIDIYPTFCDIAGISKPPHLEGESLTPLMNTREAKSKGFAISNWEGGCTIIKDNIFYTEWWDKNDSTLENLMFDHNLDKAEIRNVANDPKYTGIKEDLSKEIKIKRGIHYRDK
jgi:iduronate 2-sulfatase